MLKTEYEEIPHTKQKIALCHEKITNTRKDYLHKIVNENQIMRIYFFTMED